MIKYGMLGYNSGLKKAEQKQS